MAIPSRFDVTTYKPQSSGSNAGRSGNKARLENAARAVGEIYKQR